MMENLPIIIIVLAIVALDIYFICKDKKDDEAAGVVTDQKPTATPMPLPEINLRSDNT